MRAAPLCLLLAGLANASPVFIEQRQAVNDTPSASSAAATTATGFTNATATSTSSGVAPSATTVAGGTNSSSLPTAPFSWTLNSTTYNASSWQVQPYVANGYIGARLPAAGMGFQSFEPAADDPENGGLGVSGALDLV